MDVAKSKALPVDAERLAQARAVMQAFDQERKYGPYESSSSDAEYWVIHHSDGHLSCNCRGWVNRRRANPSRECKHQTIVIRELTAMGAKTEIRPVGTDDHYVFIIEKGQ